MDWSKFFTPEAVAAYITFIGTIIITSIGWIVANRLSKKKPNIIRVSRESATSLLEIPVGLRKNIKVTYKSDEVPSIYQTQFEIINIGEDVVEGVSFSIHYSDGNAFDVIIEDPLGASRQSEYKLDGNEAKITLSYINPYSSLKDRVKVTVLSDREIKNLMCTGGGKSWKTDYVNMLGLRLNYATLLARVDPRNPKWVYEYISASFELFTRLLKI